MSLLLGCDADFLRTRGPQANVADERRDAVVLLATVDRRPRPSDSDGTRRASTIDNVTLHSRRQR